MSYIYYSNKNLSSSSLETLRISLNKRLHKNKLLFDTEKIILKNKEIFYNQIRAIEIIKIPLFPIYKFKIFKDEEIISYFEFYIFNVHLTLSINDFLKIKIKKGE